MLISNNAKEGTIIKHVCLYLTMQKRGQLLNTCVYISNKYKKTFKNEQRNRDDTAKKRVNTSGVGESNNYYEDIYNIYIPPYNNTHLQHP